MDGRVPVWWQEFPNIPEAAWIQENRSLAGASDLSFLVNQLVRHFGPGYYKLADQMRSAAIAVSGNIAEGYCSGSLPNYIRYCNIARGSLGELGSYTQDCERAELITGNELTTLIKQYGDTSFFLDRLIQLSSKKNKTELGIKTIGSKKNRLPT